MGTNGHIELLTFEKAPQRVISMVPSMTESMLDLGLVDRLIGVTDYCVVPGELKGQLERVGGTKSINTERVIELEPDLVLANQEENARQVVEALEDAGVKVWVTFPKRVEDAIRILYALVQLFRFPEAIPKIRTLEHSLEWVTRAKHSIEPVRYFCPIWQAAAGSKVQWWMTFNHDTYAHDLLEQCGGENIFAERRRRYPLAADLGQQDAEEPTDRDTRYPRVTLDEILGRQPELILLPSEPFAFGPRHKEAASRTFESTPAGESGRIHLVDGSLITWHGTRLARALAELPAYFEREVPSAAEDADAS